MNIIKPNKNSPEFQTAISVKRMRESDKYTIENLTSGSELMYRAAMGIFNAVNWIGKKIAIVCGSGNNGGDGYALAGILADNGFSPILFRVGEKFSDDGRYYYNETKSKGVKDEMFTEKVSFNGFDIIVDCILGTGFRGSPEGLVATAIRKINESGAYIVSADINSGLDGDSGQATLAVHSDLTVSIGYYKTGMFLNDAPRFISGLVNVDIGIVLVSD